MEIPGYGGLEEVHRSHRCLVVRARRIADGRAVVLKAVTPGPGNEKAIQTLRQEHRMLVSLAGVAGVVQALGLEENAGLPLLVLDDAGPIRLSDRLDRKPMELGAFLPLALRLAETVAVLHARGVVHRDVNPSNVGPTPRASSPRWWISGRRPPSPASRRTWTRWRAAAPARLPARLPIWRRRKPAAMVGWSTIGRILYALSNTTNELYALELAYCSPDHQASQHVRQGHLAAFGQHGGGLLDHQPGQ